jgi:protein-tyrosine phosphatase
MDWITEQIAIGNRTDAHDAGLRERIGFRCVISLDGSMTEDLALSLGYDDCETMLMIDGPGNHVDRFRRLVRRLMDMVDCYPPVLVHCQAGRSRSVTLVAAYLALSRGMATAEAYRFISQRRETCVTDGLEKLVDACPVRP